MFARVHLILLLFALPLAGIAQSASRTVDFLDGTSSFAKYQGSLSVHYSHLRKLGKAQKFSIGYGARITSYLGANQYYITAPAEFTSESTSPLIIFRENVSENIDTFLVKSPMITMVNVSINIHYQISSRLTAGFNIDALGFSFGGKRQGNYISGVTGKITQGTPTQLNLLLISDNDRGSLNSELFAKYKLNNKWSLKAGLQFLFTEYTTGTKVQQFPSENDRFRNKSLLLGLGVSYKIR